MSGQWAPERHTDAVPRPPSLTVDDYLSGILAFNRGVLSRAITLIESSRPDHQRMARELIARHRLRRDQDRRTGSPESKRA
jgi:LAO/AO transport system kinase